MNEKFLKLWEILSDPSVSQHTLDWVDKEIEQYTREVHAAEEDETCPEFEMMAE